MKIKNQKNFSSFHIVRCSFKIYSAKVEVFIYVQVSLVNTTRDILVGLCPCPVADG